MKFQTIISVLIFLVGSTLAHATNSNDELYRTHFKEKIPLKQNLSKVAVQLPAGTIDEVLRKGIPVAEINATQLERHAVKDWVLINLVGQTERSIRELITELGQMPNVQFASPVFFDDLGGPMFVTPYLLASFVDGISQASQTGLLKELNLEQEDVYGEIGILKLHMNTSSGYEVLDAANDMAQRASLLFAEPDMILTLKTDLVPNDPQFGDCWGLLNTGQAGGTAGVDMKASQAWDITTGDASIITVVFDNGVQQNHPDLNQVAGNDFTSDASTTGDPVNGFDNHGTAVAGCVSATINNSIGTVGVAPNTKIAGARFSISTSATGGTFNYSWLINAINWGNTIGARVTVNSNSLGAPSAGLEAAYTTTRNNGMVHFASSGNDDLNALGYPASLPTVMAVGAAARTGLRASFSNFNAGLALSAPGQSINTTDRTGADGYGTTNYIVINGTSFAAPYAAGVAALLLSHVPSLNALQVEATLQATASDYGSAGFDNEFGHGMVNAFAALSQVAAPSDNVCNALPLVVGTNGPFTNVNATLEPNEPTPPFGVCTSQSNWCFAASHTVWFSFVAPPSGYISINFGASQDWNSQIAIWSSPSCNDLLSGTATLVAANDDSTGVTPYHAAIFKTVVVPGETYFVQVDGYNVATNNAFELVLVEEDPKVRLNLWADLGGAYDPSTGFMNDALRGLPDFPLSEPYTALGYPVQGNAGAPMPSAIPGFFQVVDYIIIELRDPVDPSIVVYNHVGIVLNSGQLFEWVGGLDNTFEFDLFPGDYYVALRHRNHLGCMTAAPVTFADGVNAAVVDFRSSTQATFGTSARQSINGANPTLALWAGDESFDGEIKYIGAENDRDPILTAIGGGDPTAIASGYRSEDINLDGVVKYIGANNDRDPILVNIGGNVPTAVRNAQLP